ncbi:hypothetical protein KM043_012561 [Ampulex compressa]|nr:hypothetical protein KM043_012561 [Ampulex compressa]
MKGGGGIKRATVALTAADGTCRLVCHKISLRLESPAPRPSSCRSRTLLGSGQQGSRDGKSIGTIKPGGKPPTSFSRRNAALPEKPPASGP